MSLRRDNKLKRKNQGDILFITRSIRKEESEQHTGKEEEELFLWSTHTETISC